MKYGIIGTLALYLLDRYGFESLPIWEILLPVVAMSIIELFSFIKYVNKQREINYRKIKQESLKDKWRQEKSDKQVSDFNEKKKRIIK